MIYSDNEIKLIMESDVLKDLFIQLLEVKLKTDLKLGNEQLGELNNFNNKKEEGPTKVKVDEF